MNAKLVCQTVGVALRKHIPRHEVYIRVTPSPNYIFFKDVQSLFFIKRKENKGDFELKRYKGKPRKQKNTQLRLPMV
jgi:hypothetical protein